MPRIPRSTIRQAHRISPHAATLLPACRDLPSALNELRWIRQHVLQQHHRKPRHQHHHYHQAVQDELRVASLCRRRGRGEPLQYVLGTQPFGDLELMCRPGVLIPRPEPEAYATHLATLIRKHHQQDSPLYILDLCTGTGCIALLLHSLLYRTIPGLRVRGVDISARAVALARANLLHHHRASPTAAAATTSVRFHVGDIFDADFCDDETSVDVLVCNPPYVSPWAFDHQTARSVRTFEPKLAQVPDVPALARSYPGVRRPEDVFYARLLDVGAELRPRLMLFEVGDLGQAVRVVEMVMRHEAFRGGRADVEVWRDWPDASPGEDEETKVGVFDGSSRVRVVGSGHGRSVFIQCR